MLNACKTLSLKSHFSSGTNFIYPHTDSNLFSAIILLINNRILIFGDSITWGAWDEEGGWATRLKRYTDKQAIDGFEGYDAVYPLGISGDNSDDLSKRFKHELESRLDEESDIVVVLAIGINDAQFDITSHENRVPIDKFEQNIKEILSFAKLHAKEIVIVGLTPVDDSLLNPMPWKPTHGYKNENVKRYDEMLSNLAKEHNRPFVSLYEYLSEYGDILSDGLHPNTKGHELIFQKILSELKTLDVLS